MREVAEDVGKLGGVDGPHARAARDLRQEGVEHGLVPVVQVDGVAGGGEVLRVPEGLARHDDVSEDAGGAVELAGGVGRGVGGEIGRGIQRRELADVGGRHGGRVGGEEGERVAGGGDVGVGEEGRVVVAPAHHGGDAGEAVLPDELRGRRGQKVAVDRGQPDVADVVRRVGLVRRQRGVEHRVRGEAAQARDGFGGGEGRLVAADVVDEGLHGVGGEVARDAGLEGLALGNGLLEGGWLGAAVGHDVHADGEA